MELLPCPFCGARFDPDPDVQGPWLIHERQGLPGESFRVECLACEARAARLPTEKGAIKAWNTRAAPEPAEPQQE